MRQLAAGEEDKVGWMHSYNFGSKHPKDFASPSWAFAGSIASQHTCKPDAQESGDAPEADTGRERYV